MCVSSLSMNSSENRNNLFFYFFFTLLLLFHFRLRWKTRFSTSSPCDVTKGTSVSHRWVRAPPGMCLFQVHTKQHKVWSEKAKTKWFSAWGCKHQAKHFNTYSRSLQWSQGWNKDLMGEICVYFVRLCVGFFCFVFLLTSAVLCLE